MPIWKDANWLLLDLETTDREPDKAHPVEVGLVWMTCGNVVDTRRWLVKPPLPIPAETTAIHGISDADVEDAQTIKEIGPEIIAAVEGADVLAGYNAYHYDFPIISRLAPGFRDACKTVTLLDPLVVVRLDNVGRWWKGKGRHRLMEAARRLGIEVDDEQAHGAVYDSEIAGRILGVVRDELSDDGAEAQRYLVQQWRKQDADFKAWLAKQPPLEET